jgi:hypothetical protein
VNLKKLAMLTTLSAAWSFAFADTATFDGPFVQAGIGIANSQTDITTDFSFGSYRTKLNDDNPVGHASAGWSHAIGQWNLAGSVCGVIGDQDAGPLSHNDIEAEFKLQDTWGVSIDPGYYPGFRF